jgi:uncharacterized membrane protein YphA (DoxX/SURF4 family)
MLSLSHIIYGLIAIVVGSVMLRYNYQLVNLTGRQDWVEDKLGSGSTYFVYKLVAVAIIIGGLLYVTGLGDPFFNWLLSPLRALFPPPASQ